MNIKHLVPIVGVIITLAVSSCQKEGIDLYEGNYSFKTSGTISVEKKSDSVNETENLSITSEAGQMNILKKDDDSAIITMNVIGGDVFVLEAVVENNTLRLVPSKRKVTFKEGVQTVSLDCSVSGIGEKLKDVVIFTLTITGSGSSALYNYTITDSDVKCVANLNK